MNPAAVPTLLQLPPDPVVYRVDVSTVGWLEIGVTKSGVPLVKAIVCGEYHVYGLCLLHVSKRHSRTSDRTNLVSAITVLETEIFRHRYLKYNNSTVKQYFRANFCGSFIDIFKIQCT